MTSRVRRKLTAVCFRYEHKHLSGRKRRACRVTCAITHEFLVRAAFSSPTTVDTTSANLCVQSPTTAMSSVPAICPLAVACAIALAPSSQQSHAICLTEPSKVSPVSITVIAKSCESYLYSAHEPITITRYKHHISPQTRINLFDLQIRKSRLYQRRTHRFRSRINLNRIARAAPLLDPADASRIFSNLITDLI